MRNLPSGERSFGGAPFRVIDPASNGRKAVVGVSARLGFPSVGIPIHARAGALYLLHAAEGAPPELPVYRRLLSSAEGWLVPDPPKFRTGKTVAVIGSGPAGVCAAEAIRARLPGEPLTMVSRDPAPAGSPVIMER